AVYHGHFKCNLRQLTDYPHLWGFTRELYQWPGVDATVDMGHIKQHYYRSHPTINPNGIVPAGPIRDFGEPHGRAWLPDSVSAAYRGVDHDQDCSSHWKHAPGTNGRTCSPQGERHRAETRRCRLRTGRHQGF